jgi:fatty acid kinase fatty acid binding subunit
VTVRIVTDSSCDLRGDEVAQYGIEVVPLSIRFGDKEYVDREELTVSEFYRLLAASDDLPETAAPAPGRFAEAFRRQLDGGADGVVCINISSGLSATMQSAQTAADQTDGDIRVVDSRSITAGLGSIVIAAAQLGVDGASTDEIVAAVASLSERTQVFGALDTLENLKKGGRIGGAQALLGSMLAIKPIIDISTGEVEEAGKVRTRKKSLVWLRDKLAAVVPVENLAVMHGDAPDIDDFLALIEDLVDLDSVRVEKIGPVVGTHGGPRVMGIAFQTIAFQTTA